jgi:hypothetical protein
MRNVSDESYRGYQNTHFVFNNVYPENRAVCERMWEKYGRAGQGTDGSIIWQSGAGHRWQYNMAERGRAQMAI